ncbi:MAG: HlyD family efflux transporter periplasmic adaptor subunit [Oscillospiraceae bacterium]
MKSYTIRILSCVLLLLLCTIFGSQVYNKLTDQHKVEEAVVCDVNEDITFDGIIIRDEKILQYNGKGIVDYTCEDGSKISVGSTIANVYENEDAIIANQRITKLNGIIDNLKRSQNPGTINYIQPDALQTKIDNEYKNILFNNQKGDFSTLSDSKDNLSLVINIYNMITGQCNGFEKEISTLKKEVNELKEAASPIAKIKSQETGYLVTYADGYEGQLTTKNASSLTEDQINDIINSKITIKKDITGKIFNDYNSKIVGIVKKDKRITKGAEFDMMINSSNSTYKVSVDSVKQAKEDDKIIVVLSCDKLDDALLSSRVQSATIIFDKYSGVKVPRKAIRFKNGQKGVYVLLGQKTIFKKIDVIYEDESKDYVISKNTSDDNYLLLHDQILLEVVDSNDAE